MAESINDFLTRMNIGPGQVGLPAIPAPMSNPADKPGQPASDQLEDPSQLDPADMAPATEADVPETPTQSSPGNLVSAADQEKINAIPLPGRAPAMAESQPPMDSSTPAQPQVNTSQPNTLSATAPQKPEDMDSEKLLKLYQSLKPAQDQYAKDLGGITMLQGGNQIAQAIASGYGGKIGAGEEGIKALQAQAKQPLDNIKQQLDTIPEVAKSSNLLMELKRLKIASDPNSDISKLARENAINQTLARDPNKDQPGVKEALQQKFQNASALDLEKMGFKGAGMGTVHVPSKEERFFINGHPAEYDPYRGYVDTITKKVAGPNDVITNAIPRVNPINGQMEYFMPDSLNPTKVKSQPDSVVAPTGTSVSPNSEEKQYTINDLNQANTKIFDKNLSPLLKKAVENPVINGLAKVNQNANTMLAKLEPDPITGKVDSGNLAAARAQFAQMSIGGPATDSAMHEIQGAGGYINQAKRIFAKADGEMTPEDIKFLKTAGYKFQNSAQKAMQDYTQSSVVDPIKSLYPDLKLSDDNVRKIAGLQNLGNNTMVNQAKAKDAQKTGLVTIQGPSGQTVQMKKDKAAEYLKKPGYKLVQ